MQKVKFEFILFPKYI